MVAPYSMCGSYGQVVLQEVDKPVLPDVFHIDDLLDFSNEDIAGPIVGGSLQLSGLTVESSLAAAGAEAGTTICSSSSVEAKTEQTVTTLEENDHKTDLCVPCDDLAELEWLSSFVEDSFTMGDNPELLSTCGGFGSSSLPQHERTSIPKSDPYQKSSPISVLENSATSSELTGTDYRDYSVPGRARSKRSRTGARIWTSTILPSSSSANSFESMGTESYSMSFSPIVSETISCDSGVDVVEQDNDQDDECEGDDSQSSKRYKVTTTTTTATAATNSNSKGRKKGQDITQPWRCMHCQTQRTPQWRTGPMGPKTLCNACGVRYKSGRLLPEYRPAGSPSYVAHKHSHSHKKVLEMRRDRELRAAPMTAATTTTTTSSQHHQQNLRLSQALREKTASPKTPLLVLSHSLPKTFSAAAPGKTIPGLVRSRTFDPPAFDSHHFSSKISLPKPRPLEPISVKYETSAPLSLLEVNPRFANGAAAGVKGGEYAVEDGDHSSRRHGVASSMGMASP